MACGRGRRLTCADAAGVGRVLQTEAGRDLIGQLSHNVDAAGNIFLSGLNGFQRVSRTGDGMVLAKSPVYQEIIGAVIPFQPPSVAVRGDGTVLAVDSFNRVVLSGTFMPISSLTSSGPS